MISDVVIRGREGGRERERERERERDGEGETTNQKSKMSNDIVN
jgi:hypothetical protein